MHIDDAVTILGEIALFSDFSEEQLRLLAFVAEDQTLRGGEVLYRAGDDASGAYVLCAGVLVASEDASSPRDYTIRPRALVGEMGLMLTRPRGATLTARGPAELLFVPRTGFLKLLRTDPALAGCVAERLREELVRYLDAVTQLGERFRAD